MTEEKKSMVPKLRFPGFNETWEQRELSSLSELITKGTSPLGNGNDGDINFIKVENLDSFSGKILSCSKVSKEEHLTYLRRSILYKGDILFSIAGTLGRTAIVPEDILPANTNQALAIIRTKNQDPRFLFTALKSRTVTDFIKKNPTVGAQPNLSLAQVGSLKIPYPSRAEQEKIGEFFSQLDTTITLHQRKLEGLSKLKKSLLQKMFPKNGQQNPELRFPGFTEAWEQRKFYDCFKLLRNNSLARAELAKIGKISNIHYGDVLINYPEVLNISTATVPFIAESRVNSISKDSYLENGDIVIADTAEDESVGKTTEIQGITDHKIVSGLHTIPCRPLVNFSPNFLGFLLNSPSYHDQLKPLIQGIKVSSISKKALGETRVCFAKDLDEQAQIGGFFNGLEMLITLHQRKLESLKKLKKSLLQQMFV